MHLIVLPILHVLLKFYLVTMINDYATTSWLMCFLHVVAIVCLVCPNVRYNTFAWVAVYAKVSGLDILF